MSRRSRSRATGRSMCCCSGRARRCSTAAPRAHIRCVGRQSLSGVDDDHLGGLTGRGGQCERGQIVDRQVGGRAHLHPPSLAGSRPIRSDSSGINVGVGSLGSTSTALIAGTPCTRASSTRLRSVTEDIEQPLHAPSRRTNAVPSSTRAKLDVAAVAVQLRAHRFKNPVGGGDRIGAHDPVQRQQQVDRGVVDAVRQRRARGVVGTHPAHHRHQSARWIASTAALSSSATARASGSRPASAATASSTRLQSRKWVRQPVVQWSSTSCAFSCPVSSVRFRAVWRAISSSTPRTVRNRVVVAELLEDESGLVQLGLG